MPTGSALSPECRLLFRTAGPGHRADEIVELSRTVEWPRVAFIASQEVAGSALWRALERGSAADVPAPFAELLRRQALVTDFRMLHLSRRLQRTVQEFHARGVPVMLLKGSAIGALTDPSFRERPMNDLDVLVRRADVDRACGALREAAWQDNADPLLGELLKDHRHLPPFTDAAVPDLRLELHVALMPPGDVFAIDDEEFWREAQPAPAPFEGALVPSAEHLLLHACTHFAWSHAMRFGAWRTMRLANALVSTGRLDWERFVALVARAGAGSSCYWTLRLARRLAGVEVPAAVLDRLATPRRAWLREALERSFIAEIVSGEGPPSPSLRLSRFLWLVAIRPGRAHADGGQWDHDPRWSRDAAPAVESSPRRLLRHLCGLRSWWGFATRTLVARD